ncbi:DUF6415 family natural product biosynthesis protein [Streptomyces sp. NPDC059802]|uniref:DUF6415 family natural product biosynthesis protein n=1 Tax=Streptomyces sp. NPDC059802 TaxID=3346952 RepID=UPI0036534DB4
MIRTFLSPRRVRRAAVAPCLWRRPRLSGSGLRPKAGAAVLNAEGDVRLVLGDHAPLPALQSEVDELLVRFSHHLKELEDLVRAIGASPQTAVGLGRARRLGKLPRPCGHMESRIHLVMVAESVQELLAQVRAEDAAPKGVRRLSSRHPPAHPIPRPPVVARWTPDREDSHV